jgi:capsular exopolysaccharide synthesis family protein
VVRTDCDGLAAEQFRILRRTLSRAFDRNTVLMISSPSMGDGKTLTSVNLSSCLAEAGDPTLLVEMDVRRPTIRKILGYRTETHGVEAVFAGKLEPGQAVYFVEELSFHAAIIDKIVDDPSHLIIGTGVRTFLAWARERFRWVVLDTAPVLPAADVSELLPYTDAALLVVRAQSTPRELCKRSFEMLGSRLHGVVLNEATINSNPYYRYLNDYGKPTSRNHPRSERETD